MMQERKMMQKLTAMLLLALAATPALPGCSSAACTLASTPTRDITATRPTVSAMKPQGISRSRIC